MSNPPGYLGLAITFTAFWALCAGALGMYWIAAVAVMCRAAMAWMSGVWVMGSRDVKRYWWMIPARDLYAAVVWASGIWGSSVVWRGVRLRLSRDGRLN